jgi:hypothetical protein
MESKKKIFIDIKAPERISNLPPKFDINQSPQNPPKIETNEPILAKAPPQPPVEYIPREIIRSKEYEEGKQSGPSRRFRIVGLATIILFTGIALVSAIGFWDLKKTVAESAPRIYAQFKDGGDALLKLETENAKLSFGNVNDELGTIETKAGKYGFFSLAELWGTAVPKLKLIPQAFGDIKKLAEEALQFTSNLEMLRNEGIPQLFNENGKEALATLDRIHGNVINILTVSDSLKTYSDEIDTPFTDEFLNINLNLAATERFLGAIKDWFSSPREKRILVLFQNPSELRPAGGFLGSYAEIMLTQNGINNIVVWDIYDPDGQLDIAIQPPYELQTLVTKWGARDANWFFDFPTSAQKVISMLETSKIYREQIATFDGAIAINIFVLQSLLAITGQVELPEYNLTIHSENFLTEIQREVEAGNDKKTGEPKRILKVLAPILFDRLSTLTSHQKQQLFKALQYHTKKKDIMMYFKKYEIQNFLEKYELAGKVFPIPENFNGDYLAVVNTNIAGGKTDIVMNQHIKLSSKIEANGRIDNFLTIERIHDGITYKDPWYRKNNQSYIKIFTPKNSRLTYVNGNDKKIITPSVNYETTNFLTDPTLNLIETSRTHNLVLLADTLEESGKTVFGVWQIIKAGDKKTLELQYFNPKRILLSGDEIPYEFIFEKQSGNRTAFDLLLEAPPGYIWQETGNSLFNYVDEAPHGRIQLKLTLLPIQTVNQRLP